MTALTTVPAKVWAPFTTEQVESLNGYQESGMMHPFTCRADHGPLPEVAGHYARPAEVCLVATVDGWVCPECPCVQAWAWEWMADGSWRGIRDAIDGLRP